MVQELIDSTTGSPINEGTESQNYRDSETPSPVQISAFPTGYSPDVPAKFNQELYQGAVTHEKW